jgi:rod shape-determining protein MreC
MAVLDIRQRTGWFFVAVTVGHLILISAQVNTERGVPLLEAVTFGMFAEVQRATSSAVGGVREGWENYFALQQIRQENEQLKSEVAQLRIDLQQERATAQESRTFADLLELQKQTMLSTTGSQITRSNVIGSGASPQSSFRSITIDKGTQDGLGRDMAVIAPAGIVGRIITPTARASKVQLLIDGDAAAAAVIERSRAQGLVVGTGDATCPLRMDYVPGTADVKVGDVVVSSGIDGIYPKGFAIGQIQSIEEHGTGACGAISVRPAVEFSSLEAVLVVLTRPAPDVAVDATIDEAR